MKNINFNNKCKIDTSWMAPDEIALRHRANKYLIDVISKSQLFSADTEIHVTYFQEGVGSIVAKIDAPEVIGVFKMIESQVRTHAEILTYKKCQEIDILTPKVYETGEIGGYPYYIMEYFDTPTYRDLIVGGESGIDEVGEYLGNVLFKFETIPGRGFGVPEEEEGGILVAQDISMQDYLDVQFNKPEYESLAKEYFEIFNWGDLASKHIDEIKKELGDKSVLGNFDFGPRHFFAAESPVLFDPDAELVPEYFSAAFYCTPEMGYAPWKLDLRKKVMASYKEKKRNFNRGIFAAALWLLVYRKCFRLLSLPNEKRVSRAVHMLRIISDQNLFQEHLDSVLYLRLN